MEVHSGLAGPLYVPTAWVVFAAEQIFAELQSSGGEARVKRVQPEEDTTFLPGGTYFEVRLAWQSSQGFSMEEIRKRYENLGLLAAFELIRQSGGKLEGFTPAEGRQEILLCVPYVFEGKQKPR